MAGGVGARFWPMSRSHKPKQFIDILDDGSSLIQKTFNRFAQICPRENIYIITNAIYAEQVRAQIPGLNDDQVVLEPARRNTAPCIAYANFKIKARNPNAVVVVAPSDHLIIGEEGFYETIGVALEAAEKSDRLYTIGIDPTRPETNYGYIQINKSARETEKGHDAYAVKTFTEKPNADLAKVFVETGEFFWNSGMFIWSLKAIKAEMERCLPEVTSLFEDGEKFYGTDGERDFIRRVYEECPAISIDYGVMEKTQKAWVFLSNFGWSDLGTWESVYEQSTKDAAGNVVKVGKPLIDDVKGSLIIGTDPEKLVVVRGLDNVMVVDLKDVLLVCHRDDRTVKDVLTDLTVVDKIDKYL